MSSKANHPYHLVDPSPWPLVGAISALVLAVGAIMYMHEIDNGIVFTIGLLMSLGTMAVWWRDVIREGEHEGHHTTTVQLGLRYGMVLFILALFSLFSSVLKNV